MTKTKLTKLTLLSMCLVDGRFTVIAKEEYSSQPIECNAKSFKYFHQICKRKSKTQTSEREIKNHEEVEDLKDTGLYFIFLFL